MYFLPIEAKIDVLKFLDFNQLFSVRLINWHFNSLVEQYELDFARKKQNGFSITGNFDELYKSKEEILEEIEELEKISFLISKEELEPFNFPISSQLLEKWQTIIDQQIPIYLDIGEHPVDEDIAITLADDHQDNQFLFIKLPVFPKNIEELKIVRCWLYRLFLCYFDTIEYTHFIFNPEMVKLLFDDDDDDYLKFGSLCLKFSSDKPKINAVKFIADHQLINESLNLHFDPLPEDFKQYSEYLFKILTTGGFRKAKVFNRSLKDDVLFYWIINHIETSTDLTKMVANIVLHFDGWSDLNLSERAENLKESTENSISYEFSNIHNPKMKYDVLLYKRSDVKVDSVTIKKMWGDNVGFKDNDKKMLNLPNEVKLDIFKCLNFNQIFSFKQTNGYFCSLIDKYIGILAKKEFYSLETIVYKSVNDKKKYLQLNEDVKQEFGFGDFQLNSQLEEKWQLAVDKKTPMYLYSYSVMKEEPFIINFAIRLTKSDCWFNQEWIEIGDEIPSNYLLLKLPYIPKNIEEMLVWRFWLHRLFFDFSFEIFIFNNIVFNPTMLMLLFEDKNIIDNIKIDVRFGRNLLDLIMYHYKKYKESHNISLDDNSVSFPYANLKLERVW